MKNRAKPRGRLILLLRIPGRRQDQVAITWPARMDALVLNSAAMGVAQQEAAICRHPSGIGSARAGDQQGGDTRRSEHGHWRAFVAVSLRRTSGYGFVPKTAKRAGAYLLLFYGDYFIARNNGFPGAGSRGSIERTVHGPGGRQA